MVQETWVKSHRLTPPSPLGQWGKWPGDCEGSSPQFCWAESPLLSSALRLGWVGCSGRGESLARTAGLGAQRPCPTTDTDAHLHIHLHVHTRPPHLHTDTYIQTCIHLHAYTPMSPHRYRHANIHAPTQTYTRTHRYRGTDIYIGTHNHVHTPRHTQTHMHAYIDTSTHIFSHTYTLAWAEGLGWTFEGGSEGSCWGNRW